MTRDEKRLERLLHKLGELRENCKLYEMMDLRTLWSFDCPKEHYFFCEIKAYYDAENKMLKCNNPLERCQGYCDERREWTLKQAILIYKNKLREMEEYSKEIKKYEKEDRLWLRKYFGYK